MFRLIEPSSGQISKHGIGDSRVLSTRGRKQTNRPGI